MIRYMLKCAEGHGFESWFADAGAYDSLAAAQQLSCPLCGNATIEKALMAPAVRPGRAAAPAAADPSPKGAAAPQMRGPAPLAPKAMPTTAAQALSDPGSELESALAALRRQVETHSEYVGADFAAEARKMHEGDAPERAIYGEAKPEEARQLLEDGVPVMPLPFLPSRKTN